MNILSCHQCGQAFEAVRSDAKTCSRACRDARSNGGQPINRLTSPTQKRRENELFELHALHCGIYYSVTRPADRPAYLERLIDRAFDGDQSIKRMLTNPVLMRSFVGKDGRYQKRYHFRNSGEYPTLPREANRFTLDTWGVSLLDALKMPQGGTVCSIADTDIDRRARIAMAYAPEIGVQVMQPLH